MPSGARIFAGLEFIAAWRSALSSGELGADLTTKQLRSMAANPSEMHNLISFTTTTYSRRSYIGVFDTPYEKNNHLKRDHVLRCNFASQGRWLRAPHSRPSRLIRVGRPRAPGAGGKLTSPQARTRGKVFGGILGRRKPWDSGSDARSLRAM